MKWPCQIMNCLSTIRIYSILFYSILFYSILFYSILFYSILLNSILVISIPVQELLPFLHFLSSSLLTLYLLTFKPINYENNKPN